MIFIYVFELKNNLNFIWSFQIFLVPLHHVYENNKKSEIWRK